MHGINRSLLLFQLLLFMHHPWSDPIHRPEFLSVATVIFEVRNVNSVSIWRLNRRVKLHRIDLDSLLGSTSDFSDRLNILALHIHLLKCRLRQLRDVPEQSFSFNFFLVPLSHVK